MVNADGSDPLLLTGGVGHNTSPAWSPDGRTIIFCSRRAGAEKSFVYTMAADGSGVRRLNLRRNVKGGHTVPEIRGHPAGLPC